MLENKRIVAIDDTSSIRTFLRISLSAQGADFHEAATGLGGVELCEKVRPHVVVLDLGLPDIDGLEVLERLKELKGEMPAVVILTVRNEQRIKEKALSNGANAYLTKPFIMDELLDVIQKQVNP